MPAQAAKALRHSTSHGHHPRASARSWRAATRFERPRFRPVRTISVHTAAAFWKAWRALRPHEEIDVHGVTFTGVAKLVNKQLPDWAEVHFDSHTKFVGYTSAENYPAVWVSNDSHVRFYGGDISDAASGGMAGPGITLYDSSYLAWWGFAVHDVGASGIYLTGIKRASDHLDFKGDVYDWGHNLKWDPHVIKGTGLQGVNVGDSHYGVNDSRLAFHVYDSAVGSGFEMGGAVATDGARSNAIYLWCQQLTMATPQGQAGNCAQVWGENVLHNTFKYLRAQNLAGRPYQASGMYSGQSLATNTVVYGRALQTNLNHAYGKVHWDRLYGTVFEDVLPTS